MIFVHFIDDLISCKMLISWEIRSFFVANWGVNNQYKFLSNLDDKNLFVTFTVV
jgi:hypothetical protein